MKNAAINLVKNALAAGYTVSVWDGEEWAVKFGKNYAEIMAAVESVDEAALRIRDPKLNNYLVGWALVSLYGLEPDETVIDYSDNDWMFELINKDARSLAEIVKDGDEAAADAWEEKAKAGEIMRIV